MSRLLDVLRMTFYVVGIISFLVFINSKPLSSNIKQPQIIKELTTVIQEVPVNKSVIDISPNTVGSIIIIVLSLLIIFGFIYAFTTQVKKNDKTPSLKMKL